MFSKEMEALIEATLQDGVLTDQEKAVLVKRAQKEGIDVDELDVYIQSLLQKRQQEQNEKKEAIFEKYEEEKKKAIGPVCPKCGKQVPPLALVCDCGYEFKKEKHESSVKQLFDKIDKIQSRQLKGTCVLEWQEDKKLRDQEMLDAISLFPVPNTKEDIVDFLSLAVSKSTRKGGLLGTTFGRICAGSCVLVVILIIVGLLLPDTHEELVGEYYGGGYRQAETDKMSTLSIIALFGVCCIGYLSRYFDVGTLRWNKFATVWRSKFDQVLLKGRSLRADPEFTQKLDYYENLLYSNEKTTGGMMDNLNVDYKKVGKILLFILGAFIVLFLLVKLFSGTSKDNNENSDIDNVENIINGAYNDNIDETDDTENVSGGASDASDEIIKAQKEAAEQMRKAQEEMRKAMGQ